MEPFGTYPGVYTGTFWNRSGTEPNGSRTGPAKQQVQFWFRSRPVPERFRVNRRPLGLIFGPDPSVHLYSGPGVICGLSLLLVLVLAPRFFLRVLRFSSLLKNQHF